MAKAYSDDLRRKLLEAHDRGEGSLAELARRFGVSVPWAWKISRQRRRTGRMERVEHRHGPHSRMTAAVQASLRGLVRRQPDVTLVELQQGLWESERIRVSFQHLWRVLQKMGLRLKKSHSTPKNKTRLRSKAVVRRGGRR
jgi:transposase